MAQRSATFGRVGRHRIGVYLFPILLTLLAFVLHLHRLDGQGLWFDELATLTGAGWAGSWLDAIQKPLTIPTTAKPPLSYLVTHLFLLIGERDFILRLPAAMFATLTVPLLFVLGRTMFGRQVGLLAGFLLAIAPLQVRYAQEARMYAMWSWLMLLSLYLFWKAVTSREGQWWFLFVLATTLALYTHLFALLALGAMALFATWSLARPAIRARFPFRSRYFICGLLIIFLSYAPMIPFVSKGLLGGEGLGGEPAPGWDLAAMAQALALFSGGNAAGSWIYGLLLVLAVATLAQKDREILALLVLWIALPFIIVLSLPFGHSVRIRYFLFVLPLYLLLVAYGLSVLAEWLLYQARRRGSMASLRPARVLGGVTLLGILAAISAPSIGAYYVETKQNWRDATRFVCTHAERGDQIFVRHVYHQVGVLYYANQYCTDPDSWTEQSVQIPVGDLAQALSQEVQRQYWLIVPSSDEFLPGGPLDTSIRTTHRLLPATVFRPIRVPKNRRLIAPTAFRTVIVVPVVPLPPASIRFWTESETLAPGDCTWLHWEVDNVREVYVDGEGVIGHDQRQVCPLVTTSYELEVVRVDGTETVQTVEVRVGAP